MSLSGDFQGPHSVSRARAVLFRHQIEHAINSVAHFARDLGTYSPLPSGHKHTGIATEPVVTQYTVYSIHEEYFRLSRRRGTTIIFGGSNGGGRVEQFLSCIPNVCADLLLLLLLLLDPASPSVEKIRE